MQNSIPKLKLAPQVLTIGKPNRHKPSFNHPTKPPSFNLPAADPNPPPSAEQSNFKLQDFAFIPKLLSLGQDVYSMTSQGLSTSDVSRRVKDRFSEIYEHPSIALNVNVHVKTASNEQSSCNVPPAKTYQFRINVGNVQAKEKLIPHLGTNAESNIWSKDMIVGAGSPSLARSPDISNRVNCNFGDDKHVQNTTGLYKASRIRKRKACNCIKRRSLEDLMRQERSFNKQIERVRYFWTGTHNNHPFMFKKKVMEYYIESEEPAVSEVLDFSKKAINAEDMQLSISNK